VKNKNEKIPGFRYVGKPKRCYNCAHLKTVFLPKGKKEQACGLLGRVDSTMATRDLPIWEADFNVGIKSATNEMMCERWVEKKLGNFTSKQGEIE
jgi:hypothetical protein